VIWDAVQVSAVARVLLLTGRFYLFEVEDLQRASQVGQNHTSSACLHRSPLARIHPGSSLLTLVA
jgi:hypothetical protein